MKRILSILFLLTLFLSVQAERVKVRIFSNSRIELINISFDLGQYNLYGDGQLLEKNVGEGLSVIVKAVPNGVNVAVNDYVYGNYKKVELKATDTACILCLNPPSVTQRTYEGNLIITAINSTALQLVNDVDFETYLAGVAQSEIYGNDPEIFRVQATISRTWALRNINKHSKDGYNFCDHVHCQAYHNRCVRPDIMLGTIRSTGETIVDANGNLIETPFHSNSGGQTCNSEDVWRASLPYLRSVKDTFSYRMKQSNWTKTITQDKWLNYFEKTHKLNIQDPSVRKELLGFKQDSRKSELLGIRLTRIRNDFGLKSTFFSVRVDPNTGNVILDGHGYGHGVGLSQEGCIRMVSLGKNYDEIIRHYYAGAHIHHDAKTPDRYVANYVHEIEKIIADDKAHPGKVKSKKDDWLGRLFRLRDRQEREEVYDPEKDKDEGEWDFKW